MEKQTDIEKAYYTTWTRPVISIGRLTLLVAAGLTLIPPAFLVIVYGAWPGWGMVLTAWWLVVAMFGAFYIVEPLSYYPILGLAGTYMSFLAGNISSMRLPCSAVAQEVTEVTPGTKEAELVSALGIAGSMATNLIVISFCAVVGAIIIGALPVAITAGLRMFIVPAIFGAVFGQFALKCPKIAPFAFLIPVGLRLLGVHVAIIIPVSVFGCVAIGRLMYKRGWI